MTATRRILANWMSPEVAAFQLSSGTYITVPVCDLEGLGRACFAALVDWRIAHGAAALTRAEPGPQSFVLDGAGELVEKNHAEHSPPGARAA